MEMNEITYLVYDAAGEYLGGSPLREQAVGAARTAAKRGGGFADVVRVAVTKSGTATRRCRYHADGTVEQLWKAEGNQAAAAVRPHRPGDTGVIAMPMKKNVPEGGPAWRLVTCPVCGRECWETPEKVVAMQLEPQLRAACTECALAAVLTRKEVLGHG